MNPATLKGLGYLVSTGSVLLLGVAAWPGATRAGLLAVLIAGIIASIAGMAMRWASYQLEAKYDEAGRDPGS